jgi:hypothetical protein
MDTVGDAYIVAALLPEGDGGGLGGCAGSAVATRRACRGLLAVAQAMLEGLDEHRRTTKQVQPAPPTGYNYLLHSPARAKAAHLLFSKFASA